jgi:hypothetical protein
MDLCFDPLRFPWSAECRPPLDTPENGKFQNPIFLPATLTQSKQFANGLRRFAPPGGGEAVKLLS